MTSGRKILFTLGLLLVLSCHYGKLLTVCNLHETISFQDFPQEPYALSGKKTVLEIAERFHEVRKTNLEYLIRNYNVHDADILVEYMHTHFHIHDACLISGNHLYWIQSIMSKQKTRYLELENGISTQLRKHAQKLREMHSDASHRLVMCTSMYYVTFFSHSKPCVTLFFPESSVIDILSLDHESSAYAFYGMLDKLLGIFSENNIYMGIHFDGDMEK